MKAVHLGLDGLMVIEPVVHGDDRGHFFESYRTDKLAALGIEEAFVQDNQSCSRRNVLRGLHAQKNNPQGKLVRVVLGHVWDVAVDLRPDSPTFGRWEGIDLSADNKLSLWVPPGFAHGFCVLSEVAELTYKCTALYDPADEMGIRWDDPDLAIDWPVDEPILSQKDLELPSLAEVRARLEA